MDLNFSQHSVMYFTYGQADFSVLSLFCMVGEIRSYYTQRDMD